MTQEDKELLLKDLCARLPYKVKVRVHDNRYAPTTLTAIDIEKQECIFNFNVPVENCFPYLRPMSSMTEEEKEEYINIKQGECNGCVLTGKGDPNTEFLLVDFFNTHHFDYRGLIEKGLALEALDGMYK